MTWTIVTDEGSLPKGEMKAFTVNGSKVLVYHLDDGYFATQAKCPHMMAPLEKGKIIDGCKVQCRFHHAEFDIRTGEVDKWANFPPGIQMLNFIRGEKKLECYPCKVENGKVFVDAR